MPNGVHTKRLPDERAGPPHRRVEYDDPSGSLYFDRASEASISGRILCYNGESWAFARQIPRKKKCRVEQRMGILLALARGREVSASS